MIRIRARKQIILKCIPHIYILILLLTNSGVDPGAGGLQKTSDGKQKIIERIDCSGAGDVDMSREVSANTEGIIEGRKSYIINKGKISTNKTST